jgi:hypothetical protein
MFGGRESQYQPLVLVYARFEPGNPKRTSRIGVLALNVTPGDNGLVLVVV